MKKSLLALAVSLVAASGANAAYNSGADYFAGNGELILTIFDATTQASYTQDLGVTYNQLLNGGNWNIAMNSSFLSVFGGNYSNIQYNVMAVSNAQYDETTFEPTLTRAGFMYSSVAGQAAWTTTQGNVGGVTGGIVSQLGSYVGGVGFDTNPAENAAYSVANGGTGYAGGGLWVGLWEGESNRDLSGVNNSTMDFWLKSFAQDDGLGTPDFIDQLLGSVTLNLAGNGGSLTLTSDTAPEVPVPAAVWLLGSALAGLGGIARRRRG